MSNYGCYPKPLPKFIINLNRIGLAIFLIYPISLVWFVITNSYVSNIVLLIDIALIAVSVFVSVLIDNYKRINGFC